MPDYGQPNNFGGLELTQATLSDNDKMLKSEISATVETITIDSFGEDVDVMKLDIEGMEVSALNGAKETIERSRPICLVEILKSDLGEIEKFFEARRYQMFKNGPDMLATPKELAITLR